MTTHNEDVLQYRINAYEKRIADLEAQLDKLDAKLAQAKELFAVEAKGKWQAQDELAEARAQIAAKDAALLKCRSYVLNRPDPSNMAERVTLIRDIDAVLDKDAWMTPPRNPNNG